MVFVILVVFNFLSMNTDGSRRRGRNNASAREYYCYKLEIRSDNNFLLLGGRLLQQFVVDMYIKIETP